MTPPSRRLRGGVFNRPFSGYPAARYINDGGHDAPLTSRGRTIYCAVLLGAVVVGFVLIMLLR
jgi:hypothetical protein